MKLYKVLFSFIVTYHIAISSVGEPAVTTLVFPFGVRSCGMGEVGTALADDESALFFNPAGLATPNLRWRNGEINTYKGYLQPVLLLRDNWYTSASGYYQPQKHSIGGFGSFINYVNMESPFIYNQNGILTTQLTYKELIFAFGYGCTFYQSEKITQNIGISIKPFISSVQKQSNDTNFIGITFGTAVDLGYQFIFEQGFRFGITLMNIGPRVRYFENRKQGLPLTMNIGVGYKRPFYNNDGINFLSIAGELRCAKELVSFNSSGDAEPTFIALINGWHGSNFKNVLRGINWHKGIELGILNTVFLRRGSHLDINGERNELTFGAGINLFNHFRFDVSTIFGPEGLFQGPTSLGASGVRHHQKKIGLTYSGFGNWKNSDFKWWKISD